MDYLPKNNHYSQSNLE